LKFLEFDLASGKNFKLVGNAGEPQGAIPGIRGKAQIGFQSRIGESGPETWQDDRSDFSENESTLGFFLIVQKGL